MLYKEGKKKACIPSNALLSIRTATPQHNNNKRHVYDNLLLPRTKGQLRTHKNRVEGIDDPIEEQSADVGVKEYAKRSGVHWSGVGQEWSGGMS